MIRIRAARRSDGLEISAVGHADFAERGRDIVCAGVSALLYGFITYLQPPPSVATAEVGADADGGRGSGDRAPMTRASYPQGGSLEHEVGDGFLRVRTHGMNGHDATAWAVTAAGLARIADSYPGHVRLETGKELS